jgi:hypothetical protein
MNVRQFCVTCRDAFVTTFVETLTVCLLWCPPILLSCCECSGLTPGVDSIEGAQNEERTAQKLNVPAFCAHDPAGQPAMFIIDATTDFAQALARLARLMYNIERGARVYEWGPNSAAAANPKPQSGFLSISVPGVTTAAPPAVVNYRPSVGFVYYVPGVDLPELVRQVRAHLEGMPDDHLRGYLPVEAAPHATLLHRNRTHAGSDTTGGRNPYTKGWYPGELYPARHFHYISNEVMEVPSHVSYRGAFTWYFLPIATIARITLLTSFEEFNAVVSGVFLDTFLGGKEVAEPVYNISSDFFNVPPAPGAIRKALDGANVILVHRGGRFYLAGSETRECLANWKAPRRLEPGSATLGDLRVANLAPGPVGDGLCGVCRLPLWGDVYVVEDDIVAPYRMAVCEWCAGCLPGPRRDAAVHLAYPRTMAEAYEGTALAELLPLLEARVEAIKVRSTLYFRVYHPGAGKDGGGDAGGDAGYFVEVSEDGPPKTTPPCLRVPELREHRVSSIIYERLAQVVAD